MRINVPLRLSSCYTQSFNMKDSTLILKKVLFIIVLSLLGISIITLIFIFIHLTKYSLQLDYQGVSKFLSVFSPFKTLYSSMFITLSAYVAIESLSNKKIVEEGKALLELRKLFNQPDILKVHQNFIPITGKWTNDNLPELNGLANHWREIDPYIELFELANKLIDKRVISLESFTEHFGYWFECLIENDKIRFKTRVEDRNWTNFISLCEKQGIDLKSYIPKKDLLPKK